MLYVCVSLKLLLKRDAERSYIICKFPLNIIKMLTNTVEQRNFKSFCEDGWVLSQNEKIKPFIFIKQRSKLDGESIRPYAVAVDETSNYIYLTEALDSTSRVSVFSSFGEYITSFLQSGVEWIWGIAVQKHGIYATDVINNLIFHLREDEGFCQIINVGGSGSGKGEFNYPFQVAVSSSSGDVYVADGFNNRVQVMDCNLNFIRVIAHPSMSKPIDVKLSEVVYVLSGKHYYCLHIFTHAGELLRSITIKEITKAWFFSLDSHNNIFICDSYNHQINIFSSNGALLHTLGIKSDNLGMFSSPVGIFFSNDHRVFITSHSNDNSLKIFTILTNDHNY